MGDAIRYVAVTVGAGASLSGASASLAELGTLVGVITASTWDTNAMSFQGTVDGTNYFNVYNAGTEYSMAGVVASAYNAVNPDVFRGLRGLKVRSGTAGAAANQADATIVTLVLARL